MWSLAAAFFDIAIHRRGPEDLPASTFLVGLLFPVYLSSGLVQLSVGAETSRSELVFATIDSFAYLAFLWLVLSARGRRTRFRQTASAVLGTAIWLNVLGVPLLVWHEALAADRSQASLPLLAYLALFVWSIDVHGYVLARALEQPYMVGVLIVVLYVMIALSIGSALSVI